MQLTPHAPDDELLSLIQRRLPEALAKSGEDRSPATVFQQVKAGELYPIGIHHDGELVGFFLVRSHGDALYVAYLIGDADGKLGAQKEVWGLLERYALEKGFRAIQFQTIRPGWRYLMRQVGPRRRAHVVIPLNGKE